MRRAWTFILLILIASSSAVAKEWTETENGRTYRCYDDPSSKNYRWCVEVTASTQAPPKNPTQTTATPTTTQVRYAPEAGNSKCDPQIGESCRTSQDCKCMPGQTCDPGNKKALPSGCVSPSDAVNCPENSVAYGTQCVCKEGYEWTADKSGCAKKISCPPPLKAVNGKCVCNDRKCDTDSGENCANCPEDCGCDPATQACYGHFVYQQITSAVDKKSCVTCDKYCSARFGEHALYTKIAVDGSCDCECDLGYEWTDDYKTCVEKKKVAYVFISRDMSWRHKLFSVPKQRHIKDFYKAQGYDVWVLFVDDRAQMLEKMADPEVKAVAYFGHGVDPNSASDYASGKEKVKPTMEGYNSGDDYVSFGKQVLKDKYVALGLPRDKADKKVDEKFKGNSFNLDYAYLHACYSLDDDTLANALIKPGGRSWGKKGTLNPWQTLTVYDRTVSP
jgi:hypothetical protein